MATSDIATPYFEGSMVALVTPMFPDGRLDFESYKKLIDWHVQEGTKAVVVVGTTGESPSVNMDEHAELIEVAVKHAGDRIPVIAGDRKSTRLNSSHVAISYAVFCLKKKTTP